MIRMLPLLLMCFIVLTETGRAGIHTAMPKTITDCRECADVYESNNVFDSAVLVPMGTYIGGRIESEEDQDWYKFTLSSSGSILIDVTNLPVIEDDPDEYMLELWSSTGVLLHVNPYEYELPRIHLNYYGAAPGTYYVRIYRSSWSVNLGSDCYHLIVNSQLSPGICEDSYEPNNDMYDPPLIPLNEEVISKVSYGGDLDCFKFRTTTPNTFFRVKLRSPEQKFELRLYDSTDTFYEMAYDYTHEFEDSVELDIEAWAPSTYHLVVEGMYGAAINGRCYSIIVTPRYAHYDKKTTAVARTIPHAPAPVFRVYPVPATGTVYMELESQENKMQYLTITDMHGKILYTRTYRLVTGFNRIEVPMPAALPNGVYLVTDGEHTKKVVLLR
ncbi:Por secretion system C-terminal sorting domain-containing protein [Chitinophaga sp. YR627]|nr:Por secretion system C-terminal sorting domain-containing protein [Chitinophaga sp. YR627]